MSSSSSAASSSSSSKRTTLAVATAVAAGLVVVAAALLLSKRQDQDDTSVATTAAETWSVASTPTNKSNEPIQLDVQMGCFLVYEADSGGRLVLHYSKDSQSTPASSNLVGYWACGVNATIPGWQFTRSTELVRGIAGGDANKRKFYKGWCQFIKLCRQKQGRMYQYPNAIVPVDIYGFVKQEERPVLLESTTDLLDISHLSAIAVVPRHAEFLKGVKSIRERTFLDKGSIAGAVVTLSS